ncbi:MAG TPA: DUF2703 domain-containing protein [Candidatus Deferrimicrobium sp.]|nr:DUF2703 domain-containing protein [Candidatus Deferrimicrobium sp.]
MDASSHALKKEQPSCCGTISQPIAEQPKDRVAIDFLYLDLSECDRCQGTNEQLESALPIITQTLEASGFAVEVRKIHVQSAQQAAALGFDVSPTIRVNNRDIQFTWRETPCAPCSKGCASEVSCREWEYGGQWHEIPPKELMIRSILREVYGQPALAAPEALAKTVVSDNLKRFFAKQSCCWTSE